MCPMLWPRLRCRRCCCNRWWRTLCATASLAARAPPGLVTGPTTQAQADDALAKLLAYGWEPDANLLHASHYLFAPPNSVRCANSNTSIRPSG